MAESPSAGAADRGDRFRTAATASVTCRSGGVAMYHVDADGQLRRWTYGSPLDGTSGWTQKLVGNGWGGYNVFSGGGGTVFAIDTTGNLHWYLDNDYAGTGTAWDPASGAVIGYGWGGFSSVVSGGNGVIYAVDGSGNLRWYRFTGTGAAPAWAAGGGTVIGTTWQSYPQLVAGGSGVLFGVNASGQLFWYRHLDPLGGRASWADSGVGQPIGSGWSFTQIGSTGGGVIFARDTTGRLNWYRDTDPLGGSASWVGASAAEGTGWNGNQIVADVTGCVAS